MTESASTPRLRATFAIYVALVAATAVVGPREVGAGAWYYLSGIAGFLCVALACLGPHLVFGVHRGSQGRDARHHRPVCALPASALCLLHARRARPRAHEPLAAAVRDRRRADLGAGDLRRLLRRAVPRGRVSGGVRRLRRGHAEQVVAERGGARRCPNASTCARRCSGRHSSMRVRSSCCG